MPGVMILAVAAVGRWWGKVPMGPFAVFPDPNRPPRLAGAHLLEVDPRKKYSIFSEPVPLSQRHLQESKVELWGMPFLFGGNTRPGRIVCGSSVTYGRSTARVTRTTASTR